MKTYYVMRTLMGQDVAVQVNVPSHKELQKISDRGDIRVVITNFSYSDKQEFSVAKFELEDNEPMIRLGFRFKTQANPEDVMRFSGKNARLDVIDWAADMLIGH